MGVNLFKPDIEKLLKRKDVKGLIKALEFRNNNVQNDAIRALEEIGEAAVDTLIEIMEDNDNNIRMIAAEAFGNITREGVVILRGGLVKFVNNRVSEITGYKKSSLVERQFIDFVSPKFRETVLDRYRKRISFEWAPSKYKIEIISKDGKNIPVKIRASLIQYVSRPADLVFLKEQRESK